MIDDILEITEQQTKAKSILYSLLARREYTAQELLHKLITKGFDDELALDLINDFKARNLQSDHRAGQMFLSHGYKSGWGPLKIKAQMQQKGLDSYLIEQIFNQQDRTNTSSDLLKTLETSNNRAVAQDKQNIIKQLKQSLESVELSHEDDNNSSVCQANICNQFHDWFELAKIVAIKKFGEDFGSEIKNDLKNKAKLQRFLYNRGFESAHINFVIDYYNSI